MVKVFDRITLGEKEKKKIEETNLTKREIVSR